VLTERDRVIGDSSSPVGWGSELATGDSSNPQASQKLWSKEMPAPH
jgi:hypothetical protein